jgi:arginase
VAAKIVRQPKKISLLGVPSSAAAMSLGREGAPAALRAAGLVERLQSIGYEVSDLGDDSPQLYKADEQSPRARNIPSVLAAIETLKPRVEQAVKSGALPLILSGDSSTILGTIAGVRRYSRNVSMIYMSRDASVQTPATTQSGSVDGMVVSHLTGRGAPELIRFWGEPPLVRDPDLALFGVARLAPAEEDFLRTAPTRRYLASDVHRMGSSAAAETALDRIRGKGYEFVLHVDVNVIADFQATDNPGTGGLNSDEVREALAVFAQKKHLAAIEVAAYNTARDPDGSGAKQIVDLLTSVLEKRLEALQPGAPEADAVAETAKAATIPEKLSPAAETELSTPVVKPGEAWSSDDLETALDESTNTQGNTLPSATGEISAEGEGSGESDESGHSHS